MEEFDIVIVGAGTAGMTAGIYATRANKKTLILEGKNYGGQIINTPDIENFPALNHISGIEYATNQFEVSTKQVEELVKQKEYNIKSASILKQTIALAESKDATWKKALIEVSKRLSPEILEAVNKIGNAENKETEEYH